MELVLKEYPYKDKTISFTLKEKEINGINTNQFEDIVYMIRFDYINKKINHKNIKESDWPEIKKKIVVVTRWIRDNIHEEKIEDIMINHLKYNDIYPKKLEKKLKDSLKIVGLSKDLLDRNIYSLSTSEQKLVQIAIALLSNPEMIILEEPLKVLDIKNRKKIMLVLKRIKEEYHKTIVIISNDSETLLKETDHLIIMKNNKVLVEDKTIEVYKNIELLKKYKIDIPNIIEFTYLTKKKKKVKLDYFKDIRDIIKDIYKHV